MATRGSRGRIAPKPLKGQTTGPATVRGHGGEPHQIAGSPAEVLTTNQGVPIADDQNSLQAVKRGPLLLEDFVLREKITHFDRSAAVAGPEPDRQGQRDAPGTQSGRARW